MGFREKYEEKQWNVLGFAWELGYSIAIPLVLGALFGRFVDNFFQTAPLFFLLSIVFSIIGTAVLVFRKTVAIMKSIEEKEEKK